MIDGVDARAIALKQAVASYANDEANTATIVARAEAFYAFLEKGADIVLVMEQDLDEIEDDDGEPATYDA